MNILQLLTISLVMAGGDQATITVRAASDVPGARFTLGEIAEVSGADAGLVERLKSVEVGSSPLAGLSRLLYQSDVITHLRLYRFDPKQLTINCPPTIRVTRAGREIPAAELVNAATQAVLATRKDPADGVTIEAIPPAVKLLVEPGKLEMQAGAPRGQIEQGTGIVPVTILIDGKPTRTVDVAVRLRRSVPTLVAKRALGVGAVVAADDLEVASLDLAPSADAGSLDAAAVVGKRLLRPIAQGRPIPAAALQSVPVVLAGARVTVELVAGGVKITAPALARQQGAVGDRIAVFTTDTKRILTATIVDASTVRVEEMK